MEYPAVLLLPVLMLADYYGTLLGAVAIKDGYSNHFGMDHYELNPIWQDSVAGVKWFNLRHLAMTVATTAFSIVILELGDYPSALAKGFLGAMLGTYALLVGRHASNLITFRYFSRHPDEASGTVDLAHPMVIAISGSQIVPAVVPLALVAALTRDPFIVGGTVGVAGLIVAHVLWMRKARRTTNTEAAASANTDGNSHA